MARSSLVLLAACALSYAVAVPIEDWDSFKDTFGKRYRDDEEEGFRREVFHQNLRYVHRHNAKNLSFTLAMNEFGDLTGEEFGKMYLSKMAEKRINGSTFLIPSSLHMPTTVDWRKEGYVTPVKNQGVCGSCWSFSTTGSLEGQHFRKSGKLISLSEQQLVSCSQSFGNHGCGGGLMDFGFAYIKQYGLESESTYPYVSGTGSVPSCHYQKSKVVASDTGFQDIPSGSEEHLTAAIASVGPISVAIDASHPSFQLYSSGVYNNPGCSSTALDHGVLAVGYGTDNGRDYYLVKNSWGPSWGDHGYIKMSRNENNQCGIATKASFPLV